MSPIKGKLLDKYGSLESGCCVAVTLAVFVRTDLLYVAKRHSGPYCAGIINKIDYASWRRGLVKAA
jgi:hypothetical protein